MRTDDKKYITVYVKNETRDRFREIMKDSEYKGDMFINVLLDLYKKEQGGNDNDK